MKVVGFICWRQILSPDWESLFAQTQVAEADNPSCVEADDGEDHCSWVPAKEFHVEVDGSYFEEDTCQYEGQPGQELKNHPQQTKELFTPGSLLFSCHRSSSRVSYEDKCRLRAQDKAGNDGQVLAEWGNKSCLQNPKLEAELGPIAKEQLCWFQAKNLFFPCVILLPHKEKQVTFGDNFLHGLSANNRAAHFNNKWEEKLQESKELN